MKKASSLVLASAILVGLTIPSYASASENTTTPVEKGESVLKYEYDFKGLEIESEKPLSIGEQTNLYNEVMDAPELASGDIETRVVEGPGDNATYVVSPVYRTLKNNMEKEVANFIVGYVGTKVTKAAKDQYWAGWLVAKMTGFTDVIPDQSYVGNWVTKSYSDKQKRYIYHETLVHYKTKDYSKPRKVQYYDATLWWK